jgi:hypothetical protein
MFFPGCLILDIDGIDRGLFNLQRSIRRTRGATVILARASGAVRLLYLATRIGTTSLRGDGSFAWRLTTSISTGGLGWLFDRDSLWRAATTFRTSTSRCLDGRFGIRAARFGAARFLYDGAFGGLRRRTTKVRTAIVGRRLLSSLLLGAARLGTARPLHDGGFIGLELCATKVCATIASGRLLGRLLNGAAGCSTALDRWGFGRLVLRAARAGAFLGVGVPVNAVLCRLRASATRLG